MAKVLKIISIILLPVFFNSTALLSCSLKFEILISVLEVTTNECALEGENNEQSEELNEGENDIYSYALADHKCFFEKAVCISNFSFLLTGNIIDYYSPPTGNNPLTSVIQVLLPDVKTRLYFMTMLHI